MYIFHNQIINTTQRDRCEMQIKFICSDKEAEYTIIVGRTEIATFKSPEGSTPTEFLKAAAKATQKAEWKAEGQVIKKAREKAGLTIAQLSERAGQAKGWLSDIENGHKNSLTSTCKELKDFLKEYIDNQKAFQ